MVNVDACRIVLMCWVRVLGMKLMGRFEKLRGRHTKLCWLSTRMMVGRLGMRVRRSKFVRVWIR